MLVKYGGQNQNKTLFQRISNLQEKALCIINFKWHDTPTDPLFKASAPAIFYQIFIFSPSDSLAKTMKNIFYFT